MKNNIIPTKNQWEESWKGLDEAYAFKHFFGKTLKEAEIMLSEAAELYCEDFSYMPKVPFQFYFKAFTTYLSSEESQYDEYATNSFINLINNFLTYKYEWIEDTWETTVTILQYLIEKAYQYDYYEKEEIEIQIHKIILLQKEKF